MKIQLSDHFTYKRLIRFAASPVLMMIFTSLYSIVDGFFVSNFVGKTPFAAINLIMPIMMGIGTVGFMLGTGGSAIVSITLGAGKKKEANEYFSMLVAAALLLGILFSVIGFLFIRPLSAALGADGELLDNCVIYGRILFAAETPFILQNVFQSFLVTAEKPELSLKLSVAAGVTNMALDYLFIVVFQWGIAGAALATTCGQFIGGILPVFYFARKNGSLLRLVKTGFHKSVFFKACANGSSEMVTNLSASVVNILYNFQLMRFAGENGVAAYGVIMYVNFVFAAVYIGYSIGSAPLVGYHYGAGNRDELKNLFKKSLILMGGSGLVLTLAAELSAVPLVSIFASYDITLFEMTCRGFRIYSLAFLIMGVNIWGSSFFTALGDGVTSAAISFLRTLIFQIASVVILPQFLEIDGIWLAIVAAETPAVLITILFFLLKKNKYRYA